MTNWINPPDVPIQPAATVMLVRDGAVGLEVFMLQRTSSAVFGGGMYVFPGGRVDPNDCLPTAASVCDGLTDIEASRQLNLAEGGLAFWVAALRECFEEAGVLLARHCDSPAGATFDHPELHEKAVVARHHVHDGTLDFSDFCATNDLLLTTDSVRYVSHWRTPVGEQRRFDTRFFVARAPRDQQPLHDNRETVASEWIQPVQALRRAEDSSMVMMLPTVVSLQFLASFQTADEVVKSTRCYQGEINW